MDLQSSCLLQYYGWVHGTAGALVHDSYQDGDGAEPSRTSCKPLMHCSHWTEKKASIDFDRNWATFTVNFTWTASSSQRFAPSCLAEGGNEILSSIRDPLQCEKQIHAPSLRNDTTVSHGQTQISQKTFRSTVEPFISTDLCFFFFFSNVPRQANEISFLTAVLKRKKKVPCLCDNVIFSHNHNSKRWYLGEWNNKLFVKQPFHESDGIYAGIEQQGQMSGLQC